MVAKKRRRAPRKAPPQSGSASARPRGRARPAAPAKRKPRAATKKQVRRSPRAATKKRATKKRVAKAARRATKKRSPKGARKQTPKRATKRRVRRPRGVLLGPRAFDRVGEPAALPPITRRVLHVLPGNAAYESWRSARLPGSFVVHREILVDGPIATDLSKVAFDRNSWLRVHYGPPPRRLPEEPEIRPTLAALGPDDEVLLWGEADLFCLVNLLGVHSMIPAQAPTVRVAWSDEPLTTLSPEALKTLAQDAPILSPNDRGILDRVWRAYTATKPRSIHAWAGDPRLGAVLHRGEDLIWLHYNRLPARKSGLGADESFLLSRIIAGDRDVPALLAAMRVDPSAARYGWGDLQIAKLVAGLASGDRPLITMKGDPRDPPSLRIRPTEEAVPVLEGRRDRIVCCGIDKWFGGLHLTERNVVRRTEPV